MRKALRFFIAALLLTALVSSADAAGISIAKAGLRRAEGYYQPVADFNVTASSIVQRALTHGVPLYFTCEFELVRKRWYWLNKVVVHDEQSIRISYNALTRQYRISHGTLYQNFSTLDEALRVLGHQVFQRIPASTLNSGENFIASVRMNLDFSQLPKPLQINALINTDWEMDSGRYRWDVNTGQPDKSWWSWL